MEDDLNTSQETPSTDASSFSSGAKPKEKSRKTLLIVLILAAILLIGGGIYFLVTGGEGEVTETPMPTPELIVEETPTPTEEAAEDGGEVDYTIDIQIQNGTGISGEASYLEGELTDAGYKNIETGNADKTDYTAAIATYKSSINKATRDSINKVLVTTYSDVKWVSGSPGSADVQIITGLRKGATAKPSGTPVKSPTGTPKPTPKGSATPTPTGTKTPTPTPSQ